MLILRMEGNLGGEKWAAKTDGELWEMDKEPVGNWWYWWYVLELAGGFVPIFPRFE